MIDRRDLHTVIAGLVATRDDRTFGLYEVMERLHAGALPGSVMEVRSALLGSGAGRRPGLHGLAVERIARGRYRVRGDILGA